MLELLALVVLAQRPMGPTHPDVSYGPSPRNVMDVWLAKSETPTPVLVSIHGGGFRGGNKNVDPQILRGCLDAGISVVAITYRLSGEAKAPAQFLDSARAVQFVRSKSQEWNIDKSRFAATGGSAGAGISLWLGFHDDLADPKNPDPVLRESTRLTCTAVFNGQTSYDPRFIKTLFPGQSIYQEGALIQLYGVPIAEFDDPKPETAKVFEEISPLHHLSKGDAPALLAYNSDLDTPITNQAIGIHHPRFGKALKERMDALGIECVFAPGVDRASFAGKVLEFVKRHLLRQ